MPLYTYRTKAVVNCACAFGGKMIYQSMRDEPTVDCPDCGSPVYRAITGVRLNVRKLARDVHHGHDYREDLARFPGDPEALVTGARSLSKLMDARKRDGWEMTSDLTEAHDSTGSEKKVAGEGDMMRKAYEAAREEGFSMETPTVQEYLDTSNGEEE